MARVLTALAFTLLACCRQEPDFDERYTAAQQRIEAKAGAIEDELAAAQRDAAAGDSAAPPAPQSAP